VSSPPLCARILRRSKLNVDVDEKGKEKNEEEMDFVGRHDLI
jgi:hypothetical protein